MNLVVFGLTLSSSWGNGHATLWRGLVRALTQAGHSVVFFERDVPYYAEHRDLTPADEPALVLYRTWKDVLPVARQSLAAADAVIITSYCPDARTAADLLFSEGGTALKVFYDLDTPVTLARLRAGEAVSYVPEEGLAGFDLVLSYTGGAALTELRDGLGARRVATLYGHVDPQTHFPVTQRDQTRFDMSYLGTYSPDRQATLAELLLEPARRFPQRRFVIGGSGYPHDFPWLENMWFVQHVSPPSHPEFFAASRLTLNVTRADMAALGYCPSGRLFEAAACGAALLSDSWPGLETFFEPGEELILARNADEVAAAIECSDATLKQIAARARDRTLGEHTSAHRARQLVDTLERTASPAISMRAPMRPPAEVRTS
jgi:spore maturation protein CgeB